MTRIDVIKHVCRDGPLGAPICFLSIEDGGAFSGFDEFVEYFTTDGVWAPSTRKATDKLGKIPGNIISKIMTAIMYGNLSNCHTCKNEFLYLKNEGNIGYYPIARKSVNVWDDYYQSATGLTKDQYVQECKIVRPDIIWSRYGEMIGQLHAVVILGELDGWEHILREKIDSSMKMVEVENDSRNQIKWGMYSIKAGAPICAYFRMFRRGVKDQDILDFCSAVRPSLSVDLIDSLRNNYERRCLN